MKKALDTVHVIQQQRRLQACFKDEETSIAMRMINRRDRYGIICTVIGYEVKHERLSDAISSTCPKRAVDKLMVKRRITRVEQYCRTFLNGGVV